MKNTVLKFGLISGILVVLSMIVTFILFKDAEWVMTESWGYTSMLLILSLIYFGIREHKHKNLGGTIKFGQAFLTGLYISLICSVMYSIAWMVISYSDPQMVDDMLKGYYLPKGTEASPEKLKEVEDAIKLYENPAYRFGMTSMEILPVGLLLSLIFAGILSFFPGKK
jgi:hypothetical protein